MTAEHPPCHGMGSAMMAVEEKGPPQTGASAVLLTLFQHTTNTHKLAPRTVTQVESVSFAGKEKKSLTPNPKTCELPSVYFPGKQMGARGFHSPLTRSWAKLVLQDTPRHKNVANYSKITHIQSMTTT